MALKSGLAIWCYTPPGATFYGPSLIDYSKQVESLKFTTLAPGGFGQLSCKIKVTDSREQRPELAMFSRIVVMAHGENGPYAVFIGEISDPEISFDKNNGESWDIQALGIGSSLRDDPLNSAYVTQTPKQIMSDQMTTRHRATKMPLDTDQSLIFPDNPAATYSPSYMGYSFQDVLGDVVVVAGDYIWGVWAHPQNKDTYGFPTGQLQVHLRNTSTTNYQAFIPDIESWKISPTAERAYNGITIYFNDPATGDYQSVGYSDARLTPTTLTQGSAPFRWRRYAQDFSGTQTVNQAQAQAIANTYGAEMQNVSNKVAITLTNCRNSTGQSIPLWAVTADSNIFIPGLAQRATILSTKAQVAVNQFYIIQTSYSEDSSGAMSLQLQCDNWYDYAQKRIARLQMKAYNQLSNGTVQAPVQSIGSPDYGTIGQQLYNGGAGSTQGFYQQYHAILYQAPSSITLSGGITTNATAVAVSSITDRAFFLSWTATAVGATEVTRNYQSVGNCITAVDLDAGTFDHHCETCNLARQHLPILEHIRIETPHGEDTPGRYALCVDCPNCGTVECFNTALTEHDEADERHPHRATQARLIRAVQRHTPLQHALMVKAKGSTHDAEVSA